MKIDLGPKGPSGVEANVYERNHTLGVLIAATDHADDIWHHVLPGGRGREIRAAYEIAEYVRVNAGSRRIELAGHSWGGAIASCVATILRREGLAVGLETWGAKRAPWGYKAHGAHLRHKGDIVPWLPPFRPAYPTRLVGMARRPLAEAHGIAYVPFMNAWKERL